jgi:Ca2+-binding RTX toxin-like protein
MAITFGSNTTTNGTPGNDTMIGIDPTGNVNDIVYGHQGDDSITTTNGLFVSTVYGGQGNDTISDSDPTGARVSAGNVIYGNLGNDLINSGTGSIGTEFDTIYGGQGNDTVISLNTGGGTIYGNLGNDSIAHDAGGTMNFYGGQGDDTITDFASGQDVIYGNFGNDLLIGSGGTDSTHEYGGQGNDTLVFTGIGGSQTLNDVETGNLGNDLFVATGNNGFGALEEANEIVTVTDFLSGADQLAMSSDAVPGFEKIAFPGANAQQALNDANNAYAANDAERYIFVYGGTGAGYLFLNQNGGVGGADAVISALKIDGANTETSVNASDITTIPTNINVSPPC